MSSGTKKKSAEKTKPLHRGKSLSNSEFKYLSFIILAGLILRLLYVIETNSTPFFQNLFSDSRIYYDLALKILSGDWAGHQIFFMSPGYPYFIAIIFAVAGKSILAVRLVQVFLSSLNILFIYFITRNLSSTKTGYISAGIAAVFSPFIFYSGAILLETVQTLILSLFLVVVTNKETSSNKKSWLWAGLLLGLASYFRANILLLFPVMLIWFILRMIREKSERKSLQRSLIYFALGCLFPVIIVTARNFMVGNDFVLISSNGGINFYLGNNKNAIGIYKTPEDFDFFNDLSGKKYAERTSGKTFTPSEASSFWLQKSLEYIEKNPFEWLKLTGKKFLFFFDNNENPQSAIMDPSFFAENYSTILKLPLPGFFIVFIVSLFGFAFTWNRRKEYTVIYLFVLTYIAATIMFFIIGRFRVAVSPVFIVFAGIGISEGYKVIKSRNYKKILVPAVIAILFISGITLLIPKYNFTNYDAYIDIGNSLFEKHEYDKALINFQKAVSLKPDANSYVLLGNAYAAKKDFKEALGSYYKAINKNPEYALAYFNMGIAYTQTKNLNEAGKSFQKTIELDSTFAQAYRNLAIIDYIKGDYKSALFNFEKLLTLTDDENVRKTVMKDVEELRKRINYNQY